MNIKEVFAESNGGRAGLALMQSGTGLESKGIAWETGTFALTYDRQTCIFEIFEEHLYTAEHVKPTCRCTIISSTSVASCGSLPSF